MHNASITSKCKRENIEWAWLDMRQTKPLQRYGMSRVVYHTYLPYASRDSQKHYSGFVQNKLSHILPLVKKHVKIRFKSIKITKIGSI